jgi:hypothetical protein
MRALWKFFAEQYETGGILDVDEGATPPELAESSIEVSPADAFSVTFTLFSSTRSITQCHSSKQICDCRTQTGRI